MDYNKLFPDVPGKIKPIYIEDLPPKTLVKKKEYFNDYLRILAYYRFIKSRNNIISEISGLDDLNKLYKSYNNTGVLEKILIENYKKELLKKYIKVVDNYNDLTEEILKLSLDRFLEYRTKISDKKFINDLGIEVINRYEKFKKQHLRSVTDDLLKAPSPPTELPKLARKGGKKKSTKITKKISKRSQKLFS